MLRDPQRPACSIDPADIVIAEYDELCMQHPIAPPAVTGSWPAEPADGSDPGVGGN